VRTLLRRALRAGRGESAIIVPVPAAEPLVGSLRARHDPSAGAGMPAHVTLLYPFLAPGRIDAGVERSLAEAVARFRAFEFALARVDRFPGVLYIAPEPAVPFAGLTAALVARWPECPPYEGRYDDVVPHLTVAIGPEPRGAAGSLEEALPVRARADRIALLTRRRRGRWSTRVEVGLAKGDEA
jgi:2'-5' RNA ligase